MTKFLHEHAEWIAPANLYEMEFDSHRRIKVKVTVLEVSPYVYIGSHINFMQCLPFYRCAADFLPYMYIAIWMPACIVCLYYASSLTMWWFPDHFFCLVCELLEKNTGLI
jgi:hypothetical protein